MQMDPKWHGFQIPSFYGYQVLKFQLIWLSTYGFELLSFSSYFIIWFLGFNFSNIFTYLVF
jgi:hypothetical protein